MISPETMRAASSHPGGSIKIKIIDKLGLAIGFLDDRLEGSSIGSWGDQWGRCI